MAPSTSLTDDILLEIFTYLPLNSIYKLKSLSKVWLSNLSNPYFIIKWFRMNSKSLPWILYFSINDRCITNNDADGNPMVSQMAYYDLHSEFMSTNDHLFSFKFIMNHKPFGARIVPLGSSNGLVLSSVSIYPHQKADATYHVCNPLTQKWVSLPSPPPSKPKGVSVSGIFCEYSSSFTSCYKVVRIPQFYEPSKNFNVVVFCSDRGVWESFQVSCDQNVVWEWSNFDKFVILDGVLFWIEGGGRLLVYNLNQSAGHRCSLINLPDTGFEDDNFGNFFSRIGESEGWVCYAKTIWTESGLTLSVWVLNEVKWKILQKDISLDDILAQRRSRIGEEVVPILVLGFSPVDRNVVLLGCNQWVCGFNVKTRSFEELCLDNRHVSDARMMFLPFVLKPMPTVLPLPSWIDA